MRSSRLLVWMIPAAGLILALASSVSAVAPTEEAVAKWQAEGVWSQKVAQWQAFKAAGGCAPAERSVFKSVRERRGLALGSQAVDTFRVLVLLADFPDFPWDGTGTFNGKTIGSVAATPAMFDSLLFSDSRTDTVINPTGSFTDFFLENSYGRMYVVGDVVGWLRMPRNYPDYVKSDNGLGSGGPLLVRDAVLAADSLVDYSRYDNDGDGRVDGVIVVHAGPGAETGAYGIWSHRSSIATVFLDGVGVSDYTLNPEEQGPTISSVGVYCHEYGHILGLPDLYDLGGDPSQQGSGLGRWSLMASGSWNKGGRQPAHMDAWSKDRAGFLQLIWPDANISRAPLPQVESEPVAYALRSKDSSLAASGQYWVVENRQRVGFDFSLPGAGLLIYHVDLFGSQGNSNRYLIDVEQADGLRQLNLSDGGNSGDSGDPWPGRTNNRSFSTFSVPNSLLNVSLDTSEIAVWDITNSDSLMYADLDVEFSRPYVLLHGLDSVRFSDVEGGNGDGLMQQGETISFYAKFRNFGRLAFGSVATMTADNPYIQFVDNDVPLVTVLSPMFDVALSRPIRFFIPDNAPSTFVTFTLTLAVDSLLNPSGTGEWTFTYEFGRTVGRPEILVVDDDGDPGTRYVDRYGRSLDSLGRPYDTWDKLLRGSPTADDLRQYRHVFWLTGKESNDTSLTMADVTAMKGFLDAGGNLMMASMTAPAQLMALDSAFVYDYLHASVEDSLARSLVYRGYDTHEISAGVSYQLQGSESSAWHYVLNAENGGQPVFYLGGLLPFIPENLGDCGILYEGAYRTLFFSFAVEFFDAERWDNDTLVFAPRDTLIARVLAFFDQGTMTAIGDEPGTELLPSGFSLHQNYPNPFNPTTTIAYTIGAADGTARTTLDVFNLLGRRVVRLVDEVQSPGTYTVVWDGRDAGGSRVATGVYLYRLTHGDRSQTRKMVLLK